MALLTLIKGSSPGGESPSNFTLDIPALLATAGLSALDHAGPYLTSFSWEIHRADTTAAGGAWGLRMNWESPAGAAAIPAPDREVSSTNGLDDINFMTSIGPIFMVRSEPGALWTLTGEILAGAPGDSLINWQFTAMVLQGSDMRAF
jgi:hypothetical protein